MGFVKNFRRFIIKRIQRKSSQKPLKPMLVIDSFFGKILDSNCIQIANSLVNQYRVVFASNVSDYHKCLDPRIEVVKYKSIKHIRYLHSAKVVINNTRYKELLKKHPEQVVIQIWHGVPYKKLVFDQANLSAAWGSRTTKYTYLSQFLNDVNLWDYLFAQNEYTAERFKTAFLYDKKLIVANYPSDVAASRNVDCEKVAQLKNELNLPRDKKIVLYTPTFREYSYRKGEGYSSFSNLPDEFYRKHSNVVFLVRTHYLISQNLNLKSISNVVDVTNYPFIENLYAISDLLITDYSSVLFEFARTGKPIICFQMDKEEYCKKRGLYDVDLVSFGVDVFYDWEKIVLDFTAKSFLQDQFALTDRNLVDEIKKIASDKIGE